MRHELTCFQCGEHKIHESYVSLGYGIDENNNKICFECCGKNDLQKLINLPVGKSMVQYLSENTITNWPGTMKINVPYIRSGKHNWARNRYDTWFTLDGNKYHAVNVIL